MKRAIFAFLAMAVLGSSMGCCCLDRLFCCGGGGCGGGCGGYGHEGPGCSSCGGGGGCGAGGCSSGNCGGGGCSDCGYAGGTVTGPGGQYAQGQRQGGSGYPPQGMASQRPAQGHPLVRQRRDSGDDYEFAAGPPTGATTYPYYTNRGPRDFLARNPRDIGP